jgi:lactate dehydrogenase-like 2-hydroxyacid dehydrogenase
MDRPRVTVTRRMPQAVEDRLRGADLDVAFNEDDAPFTRERLIQALRDSDGILLAVNDAIDGALLDAGGGRRARIVANFGVGVNHIDLEAARARGVIVTNTPGVLTDATADLAMALILAATRRCPRWRWCCAGANGVLLAHRRSRHEPAGQTLGVIGMGRIGQAAARRACSASA